MTTNSVVPVLPELLREPARDGRYRHHDDYPEMTTHNVVRRRKRKKRAGRHNVRCDHSTTRRKVGASYLTIAGAKTPASDCANSAIPFAVPSEDVPGVWSLVRIMIILPESSHQQGNP